jgi:ABC-type phosphate/phosphonate transport system permease subunit
MGIILIAIVLLIIFRRTVFDFIKEHFDIKHAPPLAIWLVMLVVSYILVYIGEVMRDMTTVFWMGFIGCVIGTFLTYISEKFKKEVNSNG